MPGGILSFLIFFPIFAGIFIGIGSASNAIKKNKVFCITFYIYRNAIIDTSLF